MKKEDLFNSFSELDDNLLKRSEEECSYTNWKNIMKRGSVAACLTAALGAGIFFYKDGNTKPDSAYIPNKNTVSNKTTTTPTIQNNVTDKQTEQYVDVSTLLASNEDTQKEIQEEILAASNVELEKYHAIYIKAASVDNATLKDSVGSMIEGTTAWFKISGHEDLQYLIFMDKNETYSLWKFEAFESQNYPYNDVLEMIYNIHSADDIKEIISVPANMDNTDEGKALQKEIGTITITDKNSIEKIYHILAGLTCDGSDNWDRIELSDDSKSSMQNYVRMGRYLTLVTTRGNRLDTLKYTGASGMFYEYNGIAYHTLDQDDKETIESILKIKRKQ